MLEVVDLNGVLCSVLVGVVSFKFNVGLSFLYKECLDVLDKVLIKR